MFRENGYNNTLLRDDLIDLKRIKQQDCFPPLKDVLNGTLHALISYYTLNIID